MEQVSLGKSGLVVTRVGLGGIQLAKVSKQEAVRVICTGLDLGVNFVETARGYWDSEEKIGQAIRGRREQIVIATKAGATSAEAMCQQIDQSLEALGTDYIDLYQFHGCDRRETYEQIIGPGGAVEGLERAKQAGKIRAIGFSSHQPELALEMMEYKVFVSAQLPISFMNLENHEKGLFERADQHDMGLIAMKPFGGGRLDNARLCMGYILSLRNVVAVVGVDRVDHVRQLVDLAEHPPVLDDEDRKEMERIRNELGTGFCRACNYCQPCPQKIKIYQILWLPVYLAQMGPGRVLTKEKIEMLRHGQSCTECRECEERCPFDLKIIDGLKQCRLLMEDLIAAHHIKE